MTALDRILADKRNERRVAAMLAARWHAVVNDEVGGWAVATADKPLSELARTDETGEWMVADFTSEALARHIAELHNAALDTATTR